LTLTALVRALGVGYRTVDALSVDIPMTDPAGAAIYGVPWIPSRLTPVMLALVYQHQPDPSWDLRRGRCFFRENPWFEKIELP